MWTWLWEERVIKVAKKAQISVFVEDIQVVDKAAWKVVSWTVEISY